MRVKILTAILFTVAVLPAQAADYVVFRNGAERSTEIWRGPRPVPGAQVPASATVKEWTIQSEHAGEPGRSDIHNYKLENGELVFSPPKAAAILPDPNRPRWVEFKFAVGDSSIPAMAKIELASRWSVFDSSFGRPGGEAEIAQTWKTMKSAGYPWLTPDVISEIERLAAQFKIPF